ncbi:polar amino acid transport system substrate-binding protein [Leucobacter exalbidus]|uniref:Polar amino acid transport system substrate-binding protein n=1 Tax=Leucobacter exalbidus TaxID=662960 RepID=A0A940PSG5_9MICO|nr:ABC transporter substrate-binding protein [Leucobacter exalbidus]MBP1325948.1 polar amino acid transport system substrate-binding protein [Leucobacter exalbidus]
MNSVMTRINRPGNLVRALAGVAGAGLLLAGLTACGGESLADTEKPAESTGEVEFMAVPDEEKAKAIIEGIEPSATAAAELPANYATDGIKFVTSVGYPPMEEWGTNKKDIIGVDPAIAHAIARKLGVTMTLEDQEFNSMIPGLISNRYDVLMSSMTDNAERRETTTFVDYVSAGNAFLVSTGNPENIAAPADLCGKIVAVVDSGSSAILADEFSEICTEAGSEPYEVLRFDGDAPANLAVQSGRAVATITDFPVAKAREADPANKMEAIAIDGGESLWGIGVDKADTELATAVQTALQELVDDGTYGELLAAWNVEGMAVETVTINGGD